MDADAGPDRTMHLYTIGDMALRFGVSAESIRNWERRGAIPPSHRTPGRHRRYTDQHVLAVAQIMNITVGEVVHA